MTKQFLEFVGCIEKCLRILKPGYTFTSDDEKISFVKVKDNFPNKPLKSFYSKCEQPAIVEYLSSDSQYIHRKH